MLDFEQCYFNRECLLCQHDMFLVHVAAVFKSAVMQMCARSVRKCVICWFVLLCASIIVCGCYCVVMFCVSVKGYYAPFVLVYSMTCVGIILTFYLC